MESYKVVLKLPCSPSKRVYDMTSNIPIKEREGEDPNRMASDMRGQGV